MAVTPSVVKTSVVTMIINNQIMLTKYVLKIGGITVVTSEPGLGPL